MFNPDAIRIDDYDYPLPEELIAQFPLAGRDTSNLLVCSNGHFTKDIFSGIAQHIPENSLLVFNDTRVIRARLIFTSTTGARIEIFCLEPMAPVTEIGAAFQQQSGATWKCLVGNLRRWKGGRLDLECTGQGVVHHLYAEYAGDCGDGSHAVEFR
jgi:S-adenosylmethionine:tRNA ribosyltransferase-isomerase